MLARILILLPLLWGILDARAQEAWRAPDAESEGVAPLSPWGSLTPAATGPQTLRIVYTGGRGGVGSGRYLWEMLRTLRSVEGPEAGRVSDLQLFHGTLAQGRWLLQASDRKVATLLTLLSGGRITCTVQGPVWALATETDILVVHAPERSALVDAVDRRGAELSRWLAWDCVGPQGATGRLIGPSGAAFPAWQLEAWEFRKALGGRWTAGDRVLPITVTGVPIQDADQLMASIEQLLNEDPNAIFVDAGSFVDGSSSVMTGGLSLHRPLGYQMLQHLRPTALVPGATELVAGPAPFFREKLAAGLPYIATNWVADDPAYALPGSVSHRFSGPDGDVTVAFIGILDPALQQEIPALGRAGVHITDPVEGLQATLKALHGGPNPPDAIIALTTASGEVMAEVRRQVRGIDLMAGDPTFATLRVEEREVRLRPLDDAQKGAPLTLPLDGLATLDLRFEGDSLARIHSQPRLLRGTGPSQAWVSAAITRTRAQTYPDLDAPLLAAPPGGPMDLWPSESWQQLVCEALRLETGAHSVLLREVAPPPRFPGPLTELQLLDQIGRMDRLVAWQVPGDRLAALLDKTALETPVSCGATAARPLPDGRAIDPQRVYRLVTTDRAVNGTLLGDLLRALPAPSPLDPPTSSPVVAPDLRPATFQGSALAGMRQVRDAGGGPDAVAQELLQGRPQALPPLWIFRLGQVSLRADRFRGVPSETFSAVPETLATNPSSVALAAVLDSSLEYSAASLLWDLRARGTYSTLQADVEGVEQTLAETETADDLRLSTSMSLPAWARPQSTALRFMPFGELLYDTELTATLDENGLNNPKQRDLSVTLGLSALKVGALQALRVGAFANRDLSRLDEKPTEYGGRFELATSQRIAGALTWTNSADFQLWAKTRDDDVSDLRFRALAETRLGMPLARWLRLSTYAQGFALQGRVPQTQELGAAWMLGASFDLSGAFDL